MRGGEYFFGGGGDHLIFRRTKEGSVVNEDPKGGVTENFGRIQKEATQICLENEDMAGGGGRESYQMSLGRVTSLN